MAETDNPFAYTRKNLNKIKIIDAIEYRKRSIILLTELGDWVILFHKSIRKLPAYHRRGGKNGWELREVKIFIDGHLAGYDYATEKKDYQPCWAEEVVRAGYFDEEYEELKKKDVEERRKSLRIIE